MANELSTVEKQAMLASYDVDGVNVKLDVNFVKKYLVNGKAELITLPEIIGFINTCKIERVNPLACGEVYLIKYSDSQPASVVLSRMAFLKRAFNNPNYLYNKNGIVVITKDGQIQHPERQAVYPNETLIGGWCRVFYLRNGHEVSSYKEVALTEYNKGMSSWKTMPATMINKVAVSQALREAFADEYVGLYSADEMPMPETIDAETVESEPVISTEQRKALFDKARSVYGGNDEYVGEKVQGLISKFGYSNTKNIVEQDFDKIMVMLDEAAEAIETKTE